MKRTWYFIDIDGCIMPNIFNNQFYTNEREKIDNIIEAYKKSLEIDIYFEFLEWLERIFFNSSIKIMTIMFITGRQKNVFGWLTRYQLHYFFDYYPKGEIRFYPNEINHDWEKYKKFKLESIWSRISHHVPTKDDIIKVYDDHDFSQDFIDFEKKIKRKVEFYQITKPEDWEKL